MKGTLVIKSGSGAAIFRCCKNLCSLIFLKIHRESPGPESGFNKIIAWKPAPNVFKVMTPQMPQLMLL